jgi:hypothetical protein
VSNLICENTPFVLFIQKRAISFATDSILVIREIKTDSEDLGEFSFEGSGDDVYQLENGIGQMKGNWKLGGWES